MKRIFYFICIISAMILSGCNSSTESASVKEEQPVIVVPSKEEISLKEDEIKEPESLDDEVKADIVREFRKSAVPASNSPFLQPVLQNPDKNSITVMWFNEKHTENNKVVLLDKAGNEIEREIPATEMIMSRIRGGKKESDCNNPAIKTTIYKYVAVVDDLPENDGSLNSFVPYYIESDGEKSSTFTLQACPKEGTPLKILLTSDHQIKNMCAANIEKVYETVGCVDAVFMDGDIVDVSDRAYDWFYADNAFFKVMCGVALDEIEGKEYTGAPLLQNAPIFTAIGNHDVMGIYDEVTDLSVQFNYPSTREHAGKLYDRNGKGDREKFIEDHSYNTITYEEIFELPESEDGGEKYYLKKFGDVGLITLDVSRVWRLPALGNVGKYSEIPGGDEFNSLFGFGDFIFEPVNEGSAQIKFLKKAVASPEYADSKIKMAMFHSEAHSLGGNQIPAFTDPVAKKTIDPVSGQEMVIYDYPIEKDYIDTVITPILSSAETNLIFEAHSHLWNRFITYSGMNVLETSNVGNTYGGFMDGDKRTDYPSALNEGDSYSALKEEFDSKNYCLEGDSYGLNPEPSNVTALPGNKPFLASNTISSFSILDTKTGTVDSYYFDTEDPDSEVVLFDSFKVNT